MAMAAPPPLLDDNHFLVAALDFGTTYSGYAFSFSDDPDKIFCNKSWGESLGFHSYKTPTSVLTDKDGNFIDMGFEAEQLYTEKLEEDGACGYHLYRHFKMLLHKSKNVSMKAVVTSLDGNIAPAVTIFGYAIGFLKNHLLKSINNLLEKKIDSSAILWVITVPAIWSEPSKKFMREAAFKGGCVTDASSQSLMLALEPEAASLCCRRPVIAGYRTSETESVACPPGTTYLVLDCGGGTIDTTAHRTLSGDKIEEILPATGGPWGGIYVDKRFENLLEDIFSQTFIKQFKKRYPSDWLQLINAFQVAKKGVSDDRVTVRVPFPWDFSGLHSELFGGRSIPDVVKKCRKPGVSFSNGALTLKQQIVHDLFAPIIQATIDHTQQVLQHPELEHCKYIFLVGGFSECKLLQKAIRDAFEKNGTKVLVPAETQLAVLKGAVLFGRYPSEIAARIARRTYGYGRMQRFDPHLHDTVKQLIDDEGLRWCANIFKKLVIKGETVPTGKEVSTKTSPLKKQQWNSVTTIYSIDGPPKQPVQYTSDSNAEVVGEVIVFHQPSVTDTLENEHTVTFTFGGTEIHVSAKHLATGREFTTAVNFLSEPSLK